MKNIKNVFGSKSGGLGRAVADNAPCAVFIEQNDRLIYVNPAAAALTGFSESELLGMGMRQLVHPDFFKSFPPGEQTRDAEKTPKSVIESKLVQKDGREKFVELAKNSLNSGMSDKTIWTALDISEQKKLIKEKKQLESQLRQSRKIEALGRLAGGVAHDFNNILGSIMGFTENAMDQLEYDSKAAVNLQRVIKASQRARDLVKQILSFSRKKDFKLKPIRLEPVVQEVIQLVRASLPSNIRIREKIEENLGGVAADVVQIYQVLMNLCSNAAHAMLEKGGVLEIEVTRGSGGQDAENQVIDEGPYIRITVRDTGHGISDSIKDRIFEPYFTSKKKGEGTGFGLPLVLNIVQSHGGFITFQTRVGEGTDFHVYLPSLTLEEEEEKEE